MGVETARSSPRETQRWTGLHSLPIHNRARMQIRERRRTTWRADHVAEPSPRKRVAEVGRTGGAGNGDLLSVTIHLAKHAIDKDLLDLKGWKRFR